MSGVWVLLVAVLLVAGVGLTIRARQGKVRGAKTTDVALPAEVRAALEGSTDVTLLQVSTQFCAPCRHARVKLAHLAERTEGVRHVDLDVTEKPHVAQQLRVLSTPTTIAFDPGGRELFRFSGLPGESVAQQVAAHVR